MKNFESKIISSLVFLKFLFINTTNGQVHHGGVGNFFFSAVYNLSPALQKDLQSEDLIGNNLQLNKITLTYGGSGYSVRSRGVVLGGSGYTYHISSDGDNGNVNLNVSAGVFNIGYRFLNKSKWIGFPYGGMGAFGTNFKVTNSTTQKIFIIGTDSITAGNQAKYSTGGLALDIGFALKYLTFNTENNNKNKGAVIGIDAGVSFFPALVKWQNTATDDEISSMKVPFIMAVYARLTIGFGIFNSEKQTSK